MRIFLLMAALYDANVALAETAVKGRPALVLNGEVARVVVDLLGGSIADFHLQDQGVNPLSWGREEAGAGPQSMGHFLCLDRWASVSEAEAENGMPAHGEASAVPWRVVRGPEERDGFIEAEMAATLPLAGFAVRRWLRLAKDRALLSVREEVQNTGALGRLYNMVQHPTIGPPFLDETTVVDSNARKGYMVYSPMPNPEEPAVFWPQAHKLASGDEVDMRYLGGDDDPTNAGYSFDDSYGWVAASTASQGLLIGYIWKTAEYPWLNIWRNSDAGKPAARGLEFGTTSLPLPPAALAAKGKIFGIPLFEFLDAGQTIAKGYAAFLFEIPSDYAGTEQVALIDDRLVVRPCGVMGERTKALEAASGAIKRTKADLEMEIDALFIE